MPQFAETSPALKKSWLLVFVAITQLTDYSSSEFHKKYRFFYFTKKRHEYVTQALLFGNNSFDSFKNSLILDIAIHFLFKTGSLMNRDLKLVIIDNIINDTDRENTSSDKNQALAESVNIDI